MTDHLCVICASADPVGGWTVCQRCAAKLDDDLCAIVTLTRAAADHLTPATKPSAGGGGRPGSRPPLDLGALDDAMAADALRALEPIEIEWRRHNGFAPYGKASALRGPTLVHHLDAMVTFLRANLALMASDRTWGGLNHQPAYAGCPCDVCRIAGARSDLSRHDDDRPTAHVGIPLNCVSDHPDADGRACGWRLWTDGRNVVTCPQCRTDYSAGSILDAHDMALLPAALLILLDHREPPAARKRIENLTARGRLTVHDYAPRPGGGRSIALYRLGADRPTLDRHEETA